MATKLAEMRSALQTWLGLRVGTQTSRYQGIDVSNSLTIYVRTQGLLLLDVFPSEPTKPALFTMENDLTLYNEVLDSSMKNVLAIHQILGDGNCFFRCVWLIPVILV